MQLVLIPRAAPTKFVARLCCILLYSVFFCFACFASQTSGFGSAFPSVPVESVTRFCYALLVRNLFCLFCLTNTGFVQCYSLGSRKVCCTLVFNVALFSNFLFCVLCLTCKHRACAVLSLRLPSSLHPFGFLDFIQFAFVMRALPNKLRFVQ